VLLEIKITNYLKHVIIGFIIQSIVINFLFFNLGKELNLEINFSKRIIHFDQPSLF